MWIGSKVVSTVPRPTGNSSVLRLRVEMSRSGSQLTLYLGTRLVHPFRHYSLRVLDGLACMRHVIQTIRPRTRAVSEWIRRSEVQLWTGKRPCGIDLEVWMCWSRDAHRHNGTNNPSISSNIESKVLRMRGSTRSATTKDTFPHHFTSSHLTSKSRAPNIECSCELIKAAFVRCSWMSAWWSDV